MKTIKLSFLDFELSVELTTESPKSSYGLPVLRVNGLDYGPKDHVAGTNLTAGDVAILSKIEGTKDFLCQAPDAARWWDIKSVIA